ncbi:hypothetical protein [uncultured Adlercreutzia sp.]|uniref:hypothetical protein n=1 Tax=uncultured Adlercreutzia sp. TaxID=875803 RepID=UPI0026F38017|nr:hypothetical protein [uncultured Adlercreutzia sp.]
MSIIKTVAEYEFVNDFQQSRPNCFSVSALRRMFQWYDSMYYDWEFDMDEACGEWTEYDDAAKMWDENHGLDRNLPHLYDPDQLEDLLTAMASRGITFAQLDNGCWLTREP